MEEKEITIRKITPEDKEELTRLYDRVWPESAGHHYNKTSWAVDTSEHRGICAVADGKIIGSRSCFHTNLYYGNTKLISVQFGDSCVDTEFRRRGLFSKMNDYFLQEYFITGDELIYNISVEASRKAYEKQGWVYINSLSNLICITHPIKFLYKTRGNIGLLAGNMKSDYCHIPDLSSIPDEFLAKRERLLINNNLLHTRYDRDTLSWRLGADSNIQQLYVENIGICFFKTGEKNGLRCCTIGEVFLKEYSIGCFKKMIIQLKVCCKADIMNIAITHAHPLFKYFLRSGFLMNPQKPFLNHGVRVESDIMKTICLDPDNWAIANMDIDTF